MVYALMCEDAARGGADVRAAVNATLDEWAGSLGALAGEPAETAPKRSEPDRATWGLLPHQVAKAQAAQQLGGG